MNQDFMGLEFDNEPWNSTSATLAAAAAADYRRWPDEQLMELSWQNGVLALPVSCPATTVGNGGGVGLAEAADRLLMEEDDVLASWLNYHIDVAEGSGEGNKLLAREEANAMMTIVGSNVTPTAPAAVHGPMVAGSSETPLRTSASSSVSDERKRKARGEEEEEPGYHVEQDAELDGYSERRKDPRCASVRKLRSAEIHNRSERRRRNRINTKMKALQELIPKCNKSDKASTLDEAIEYVKSLQLQVQMMSMGCNAGPLMFPGIHTPMGMSTHMGLGMGMDLGMTTVGTKTFTGNLVYPMHQFGPIPCPAISGHPSVQLSPRPFLVPFRSSAAPAADQTRGEAINQQNHSSDAAKIINSSTAQIPYIGDPYHGFFTFQHFLAQAQSPVPSEVESAKGMAAQKATTG